MVTRGALARPARNGFTLIEVMVAVVLLLLVLFLLFRGFTAVTDAVTRGGRQSALDREVSQALRVMREDLEQMVVLDRVPLRVRGDPGGSGYPILGFLRMENQVSPTQDRAAVEYWIEAHPEHQDLRRLVRYARPSDQVLYQTSEATFRNAAFGGLRNPEAGEVMLDHLVGVQVGLRMAGDPEATALVNTWDQAGDHTLYVPPLQMDLHLAMTRNPIPRIQEAEAISFSDRVLRLDGRLTGLRIHPKLQPQPEWR